MANISNYGQVIGRLTKDVKIFTNSDGSRKVNLTVAAQDNFKSGKEQTKQTRFVPLEGFIRADKQGNGVYDLMSQGDLVAVQYSVRNNNYTDKNGNPVYGIVLNIEDVQLMESKSVTDARKANKVAAAVAAEAEVAETETNEEVPVQ